MDVVEVRRDRPDLVTALAHLRCTEWNHWHPGRDPRWWVDTGLAETGSGGVPATFVVLDDDGDVLGGLGVVATERPEFADRGPWVVGVVVRADRRSQGLGAVLMAHAASRFPELWVSTGGRAVSFYRRCGFEPVLRGESFEVLRRFPG